MHGAILSDHVERAHALLLIHPWKQLGRQRTLQGERPEPARAVELEDPRDHELAQPAVCVVEEPGVLSRAAA